MRGNNEHQIRFVRREDGTLERSGLIHLVNILQERWWNEVHPGCSEWVVQSDGSRLEHPESYWTEWQDVPLVDEE